MSGRRNLLFCNNEIYHVYNRSVANAPIFTQKRATLHSLELILFYRYHSLMRFSFFDRLNDEQKNIIRKQFSRQNALIEIIAYSIMPTHYHMLVKQKKDGGIQKFISNFQNSFAKYYNKKFKRSGSVFHSPFKARHLSTDEDLLHLSRYIHLNPVSSYMMSYQELEKSYLTSYPYYLSGNDSNIIETNIIIGLSGSRQKYQKFVSDRVDYQRKLSEIKYLLLE